MLGSPCKEKSILVIGKVEITSLSYATTSPSALIDFKLTVSSELVVGVAELIEIVSV